MNPLYQVERHARATADLFYRHQGSVRRGGLTIIPEFRCMIQRDVSALSFDPNLTDQPDLATIFHNPTYNIVRQDQIVTPDGTWRIISTNRGETWQPHVVLIGAMGGDLVPEEDVHVRRLVRVGGDVQTQDIGVFRMAVIVSANVPNTSEGGVRTRRVSATLISREPNLPIRRNDAITIVGSQVSGTINDVRRDADGTECDAVLTRGYEEPVS